MTDFPSLWLKSLTDETELGYHTVEAHIKEMQSGKEDVIKD